MLSEGLKKAMAEYGQVIKKHGWERGERVIKKYEKKFKGFRKWAYALGVMLRANEILKEKKS